MSTQQTAAHEGWRAFRAVRTGAAVWLRALRAESFPVSIVPALLGIAAAYAEGYRIEMPLAVVTLLGALAIHAATNLLQDYFDYRAGLDREGTLGGSGMLASGRCSARAILIAAVVCFVLSAVAAGYLVFASGATLAWIVAGGLLLGAGYAVPGYGLKYHLLGDVGVFLAFGVGITLGSYYVQTQQLAWYPLGYAVPFGLLVVALLHANNMRDALDDSAAGLRNTAMVLGLRASRNAYCALVGGAYVVTMGEVFLGFVPRGAVLVLVTFPLAMRMMKTVVGSSFETKDVLGVQVIRTALLSLAFGLAFIVGSILR